MAIDKISIKGAKEHNLKNIDVEIPNNRLVVITGISGSGKSSLAFDTIFQEGQRRFMDSLSAYARQFLGQLHRPEVDHIEGLSPTLCIDQKTVNRNPRSTVGTVTEISDHLRLLLARLGTPHCPECSLPLLTQSAHEISKLLLEKYESTRLQILSPIVLDRKGEYRKELLEARRDGFTRARIDGRLHDLSEDIQLARYEKHRIELVLDRIKCTEKNQRRIEEAIEKSLTLSQGLVSFLLDEDYQLISAQRSCPTHGHGAPELEPRLFSFNAPQGMCLTCSGIGYLEGFRYEDMIDSEATVLRAFKPMNDDDRVPFSHLDISIWKLILKKLKIKEKTRWKDLSTSLQAQLWDGAEIEYSYVRNANGVKKTVQKSSWIGLKKICEQAWTYGRLKRFIPYRRRNQCAECHGQRLNPMALAVQFRNHNIQYFQALSIEHLHHFIHTCKLNSNEAKIGEPIFRQLQHRLDFLIQVGLGYLSLNRAANTLSGGESQRIRLASQVGSGLQGVTYILDEPSIGLHHRDQLRLLSSLEELRNKGNSVIIVEHDPLTMSKADFFIELGPSAGEQGGELLAATSRGHFLRSKTLTAEYLRGEKGLQIPDKRRKAKNFLTLKGAKGHNLKNVTISIPLQSLVVITGVSGSGKSSLIQGTLCPIISQKLHNALTDPLPYESLEGLDHIEKLITIDQQPIGRSPRSNPATYTDLMTPIRDLFASTAEAKARGYTKSRFSFNVANERGGGRCEECGGAGMITIEMQFLNDVEVECEGCNGKRFNDETRQIRFKGKSIDEVLDLSIDQAILFFSNQPKIKPIVTLLQEVGLGYLRLGQPSTTLSGGEAQRIKLAKELHRPSKGNTLYVLDEPSTGLHMADVEKLLYALEELLKHENSILVIEHDLDIIKMADHIIDLGPEGGEQGGQIIGTGTPEELATLDSETGIALRKLLRQKESSYLTTLFSAQQNKKVKEHNIKIKNATTHNLKSVSVEIPKGKFNVITGPSGSGKTSLAFHTLFAEGQLRYIESLSTYARRFLGAMQRPPVDKIEGLAPAIAIDQSNRSKSPRSTVATSTEIHDLLRLLYARIGVVHCPKCEQKLKSTSPTMGAIILQEQATKAGYLLAQRKGEYSAQQLMAEGFVRIFIDEKEQILENPEERFQNPLIVVDRFTPSTTARKRLAEAFELAYSLGDAQCHFQFKRDNEKIAFTRDNRCPTHGFILPEDLSPRHFSFNARLGACSTCEGLGEAVAISFERLFPQPEESIWEGMHGWAKVVFHGSKRTKANVEALLKHFSVKLSTPIKNWSKAVKQALMFGSTEELHFQYQKHGNIYQRSEPWEGFVSKINAWTNDASWLREKGSCPDCNGTRYKNEILHIRLAGRNIAETCQDTISDSLAFWRKQAWTENERQIAEQPLKELSAKLQFLEDVGLQYLTLDRAAHTLSGGESQRIRLASQLGSHLTKTIYVLDEPTIGLHPRDTNQLIHTLKQLQARDNTLVLVEHDLDVISAADHIIEMGPKAGEYGGEVIEYGPIEKFKEGESLTSQYLSQKKQIYRPLEYRKPKHWLHLPKFNNNNLKNVALKLPTEVLTIVTGVSGSGKSSLVFGGIQKYLTHNIDNGIDNIENIVIVDQSPIGKSPRSTPVSYCDVMNPIRSLFAMTKEAKKRGWTVSRFTYNGQEGRCLECEGKGATLIEMHFISDVWILCPSCEGARYNDATLDIHWNELNIADVLELSVDQAIIHFKNHHSILRKLEAISAVGLGYLRLGQPSTELSGGEAQRLKLARELAKGSRGKKTCFLLDEPTTGLHASDIDILLKALHQLIDHGHTAIIIEHNIDFIQNADYLVDLGPEGGQNGGTILFSGTLDELQKKELPESYTKQFLYRSRENLKRNKENSSHI